MSSSHRRSSIPGVPAPWYERPRANNGNFNPPFLYWGGRTPQFNQSERLPFFWLLSQMTTGATQYFVCLGLGLVLLVMQTGLMMAPINWAVLASPQEVKVPKEKATMTVPRPEPIIPQEMQQARTKQEAILPTMRAKLEETVLPPDPNTPLAENLKVGALHLRILPDAEQQLPLIITKAGLVAYVTPKVSATGEAETAYSDSTFKLENASWQDTGGVESLGNYQCLRVPTPNSWDQFRPLLTAHPMKPGQQFWVLFTQSFLEDIQRSISALAKSQSLGKVHSADIKLDSTSGTGFQVISVY